jgi:hypothetical protein
VYLGVYFGYVDDLYFEYPEIMTLQLLKEFRTQPSMNVVDRVNKIFIEGIRFS